MKAQVYTLQGSAVKEIELPALFTTPVREDMIGKYVEASRISQPYSNYAEAGKRHSASGIISHKRHDWKGQYGRGLARVPRKILWRRGTQFNWVGAEVSATRGGRRAHPPKLLRAEKKINKKEALMALHGAFAATIHTEYVSTRYQRAAGATFKLPIILASPLTEVKTKSLIQFIEKILGKHAPIALREHAVRAGVGKLRGRTYKSNAGALLVTGSDEHVKASVVAVKPVKAVSIQDLYPLGRLVIYTERALQEMSS